jgi:segregation and condensation protein A
VPVAVQTPVFEGPFDLLLHLILREEVDLYEISLATIVDAYLAELTRMDTLDLEVATEFLLIASVLVELKTKRLLPCEGDLDLDDEFGLWEQRDLLLSRLVECKTFKDASLVLQALLLDASRSYPRTAGPEERFADLAPDPFERITGDDLRRAFFAATRPKPAPPALTFDHVTQVKASVTQAMRELADELARSHRATFRQLTHALVERLAIVVRFLAVLELYKQGMVELTQFTTFGDIELVWRGGATHDPYTGAMPAFDTELVDAYDG